jgi:hypothetical protein
LWWTFHRSTRKCLFNVDDPVSASAVSRISAHSCFCDPLTRM